MHLYDPEVGFLGSNGVVPPGILIAAGAALSAKLRGTDQVSVAFFGDGAVNNGAFHVAGSHPASPSPALRLNNRRMRSIVPMVASCFTIGVRLPKLRPGVIHRTIHLSRRLHCGFFLARLSPQQKNQ